MQRLDFHVSVISAGQFGNIQYGSAIKKRRSLASMRIRVHPVSVLAQHGASNFRQAAWPTKNAVLADEAEDDSRRATVDSV